MQGGGAVTAPPHHHQLKEQLGHRHQRDASPPDPARLTEIAAAHGIDIVGPPPVP